MSEVSQFCIPPGPDFPYCVGEVITVSILAEQLVRVIRQRFPVAGSVWKSEAAYHLDPDSVMGGAKTLLNRIDALLTTESLPGVFPGHTDQAPDCQTIRRGDLHFALCELIAAYQPVGGHYKDAGDVAIQPSLLDSLETAAHALHDAAYRFLPLNNPLLAALSGWPPVPPATPYPCDPATQGEAPLGHEEAPTENPLLATEMSNKTPCPSDTGKLLAPPLPKPEDRELKERLAIAELLLIGPNVTRIAEKIGVKRTTLLGWEGFRENLEKVRRAAAERRKSLRGCRDGDRDFVSEEDDG